MSAALAPHEAYVLDASVLLVWFANGEGRSQARFIRQHHAAGRCRLVVHDVALLEATIILRAYPRFTDADVTEVLTQLEGLHLDIHPLSWDLMRRAVTTAEAYGIGLTRAISVALAESLGCPMLTTDRVLLEKKPRASSMILDLAELEAPESILIMGE
ncbi:type II toxin-antitoxin system VapC family toxin [Candidatus Methylomirabilis sp.]|uniref:Type II toxin-antitoxin system VapC family toxin n=1 Tax=Candidatus Methylomirabilis tolerans TaxID=3123416 RepID=A0AAJ1AHF9_9BACT|nr:type II toxin-antitoxin system VapC family toxin [Candidatus Methylomirabilis sp.]